MQGKLYVVSGPSGAGKGTLCQRLLKRCPAVELSVSCATRPARPGEVDSVHYYFISEQLFLKKKERGELLECAQINSGYWYGTPKAVVLEKLREGKSVLLEIENNGAQQVIEQYPETVSVFILPPSRESLIMRLVGRATEDLSKLIVRIKKVPSELEAARGYTYLVLNDDIELATERLIGIFEGTYETGEREKAILSSLANEFSDMDATLKALEHYYKQMRLNI